MSLPCYIWLLFYLGIEFWVKDHFHIILMAYFIDFWPPVLLLKVRQCFTIWSLVCDGTFSFWKFWLSLSSWCSEISLWYHLMSLYFCFYSFCYPQWVFSTWKFYVLVLRKSHAISLSPFSVIFLSRPLITLILAFLHRHSYVHP